MTYVESIYKGNPPVICDLGISGHMARVFARTKLAIEQLKQDKKPGLGMLMK
jgi:hypothetical protein